MRSEVDLELAIVSSISRPVDAVENPRPFDTQFLDRVTFGDRKLARELLMLFGAQANSLLEAIAVASDRTGQREVAHRLKGAARGVGAFEVARAAEEIETAADRLALEAALAHLTARVAEARLALADLLS
jgi:HPt (histidine-containing phosphotransfer) domain-containing protein